MFLAVCLLALSRPGSASAQQPLVPAQPPVLAPGAYYRDLRNQIVQLAHEERELKRKGRLPGYYAQLITAAALGLTGGITVVGAATAMYVGVACECGPSLRLERRVVFGGLATVGVAGIWALLVFSISRARTDLAGVRWLRTQRRGLEQELEQEYQGVRRVYAPPTTLSFLLAPQQIGLRATY
jgi:hypothetical protein